MVPAQTWGLKQSHELRSWIAVHTCTKQQRDMVLPQRDISCLDSGWTQLWPAGGRKLQVTTNEIKTPKELTWTFCIFSDWRYYQLTVPSPWSLLATYYSYSSLTAITSRLQALLLPHHHISPYHLQRGKPAQKAVERLVPRNPTQQWIPRHRVHERHEDNG